MSVQAPMTSIGRRTALAVGVPMLVASLIAIGFAWRRADSIVRRSAAEEAASLADLIATAFATTTEVEPGSEGPSQVHRNVAAAMLADYRLLGSVKELRVVDREGVIRLSRNPKEVGQRPPGADRMLAAPAAGEMDPERGEYVRPLGGAACARCHGKDAARLGAVQLVSTGPRMAAEVEHYFKVMIAFTALLAAALIISTTLALRRMVTRRLSRLMEMMQRAEKGDFLVRASDDSHDEIGRLAHAFNSMLSKITELKVAEIEASREMESLQRELQLKAELERQHEEIEKGNQALARRVREVTLLLDVARSLNSTLELPEILNLVTEMVGVTMEVDQFAVMLLEDNPAQLRVAASFGFQTDKLTSFTLPLGEGASGIAAKTREPVYIADVRNDPRYVKGPHDPEGDASLLSVPMICKEKLVGVLNFVRASKAAFSQNDIVLLQLVGSQAAMAIMNARLFAETKELTLTDALTGVFNRRHLFSRLELELARAQRFATSLSVVMVDIDHFKLLNDTQGHPTGDAILKQVATLLHGAVRKVDTVARYGGEEFMVLLPRSEREEAAEVAEKLRALVAATNFPQAEGQPGGHITISLGVASFPRDGETLEALIDSVDSALYASKRGGRDLVSLYQRGMEEHPGRERGPFADKRRHEGEAEKTPAPPSEKKATG